jgi:hypothetical protein
MNELEKKVGGKTEEDKEISLLLGRYLSEGKPD